MVTKNQETNEWFKHIVRIYKNARQRLIDDAAIETGTAPSYYLEGLLYSVPKENFGVSYKQSTLNTLNWLANADKTTLVCANMQYYLLDKNPDVTWNTPDCIKFLDAFADLWNNW